MVFPDHAPNTSQEKKELLMINNFWQMSLSNFVMAVACGEVLCSPHVIMFFVKKMHSPVWPFMLIVAVCTPEPWTMIRIWHTSL